MRTKLLLTYILFCISTHQYAQDSVKVTNEKTRRIEYNGNFFINSNAITANFVKAFYTGSYINDDLKQSVSSRLKKTNTFGLDFNSKATYYGSCSNKCGFYAGVSYNIDLGAYFTKDLFDVVFYGNSMFEDKTAVLSGTKFKYMESQSIYFGLFKKLKAKPTTSKHIIQYGLNVVKGQTWADIKVENGTLYTAPYGDYVQIALKGNMYQSDPAKIGLGAFNGIGGGVNAAYVVEKNDGKTYSFELTNLGVMSWNDNGMHYSVDSSLKFEGFKITNVFALTDATFKRFSVDTIVGNNPKEEKKGKVILLPFTLHAKHHHPLNTKMYIDADLHYKHWGVYLPKLTLTYGYKLHKCVAAELALGYGGYAQTHVGLGVKLDCKNFALKAGASDLLGFVVPASFSNQGVYLMALYNF